MSKSRLAIEMPNGAPDLIMPLEDREAFFKQPKELQYGLVQAFKDAHLSGQSWQPSEAAAPSSPAGEPASAPTDADGWITAPGGTRWRPAVPKPEPDTSWSGAAQYGLHNAAAGLGATLRTLGADGVGNAVAGAVPAPANYDPATRALIDGARSRSIAESAPYLPRAALEMAPDLLAGGATAGLGSALAGPAGGLAGTIAYTGARTFGENVDAAAADGGRSSPSGSDMLKGGLTSAAEGLLAGAGRGVVGPVMRGTGRVAVGGVKAAQEALDELGKIPPGQKALIYAASVDADRRRKDEPLAAYGYFSPIVDAMKTLKGYFN